MLSPDHQTDETACAFLARILPEQGPYAAFIVQGNRKYNVFASTKEELWELIQGADAAGRTVYHACANFKETRQDPRGAPAAKRKYGRTKHNVRSAKAFWLDVDAGPGKPYADAQAAALAVAAFCRTTGLPPPLCVLSGLGLHLYWPLLQTLDPETWERYARGLKALCIEHGLQADPARTADITSVLRTPGTHHRKSGTRLVQCGRFFGPYALEQFAIFLSVTSEAAPKTARIVNEFGAFPSYLETRPFEPVTEKLDRSFSTTFEPSFAELVAENCEQMRTLRDSKGCIREPLWHAALGVLAFCEDGERLAHEWSSGDERYTQQETQEYLERWRELSGATTCRHFHELNPRVCENCPSWGKIKSPIVHGRRQDQAQRDSKERPDEEFHHEQGQHDQTQTNQREQGGQTGQEQKDNDSSGARAQSAFPLRWHGEENPNINRKWLVKHLLPMTGVGLISGQWGTAKTFVAIDLSISVMTGNPFAGRSVKRKGGVLFIAAEGGLEIPIRVCGLVETKLPDHKDKLPFAWAENCP